MIPTGRATGQGSDKRVSDATAGLPARDGDGEKIRAGISAAARRVKLVFDTQAAGRGNANSINGEGAVSPIKNLT